MAEEFEFLFRAVVIGGGATAFMDLWALLQKRAFSVPGLNYAMFGRWLGHLCRGRFTHNNIVAAADVPQEGLIGWGAHYAIGVVFAGALMGLCGLEWARSPSLLPALLTGLVTLAAPFFLLQPGMGAGIAASKTPDPTAARLRSLIAHTSFGIGLYLAAEVLAALIPV